MSKVTKPKVRKPIGPLRRDDQSITVEDSEKANLMNEFFATVGKRLVTAGYGQPPVTTSTNPTLVSLVPQISNVSLPTDVIKKKLDALKSGKTAGPDNISPELLKLTGRAVVAPLHGLYSQSLEECKVSHVFRENTSLVTDNQWAYRKGYSTK